MSNIGDDCIDLESALKRLGGNMGLYQTLLKRFDSDTYLNAIDEALQSNDMQRAANETHALKGVSANLSLQKISLVSVELERLITSGGDFSACIADLKDAVAATKVSIAKIIG